MVLATITVPVLTPRVATTAIVGQRGRATVVRQVGGTLCVHMFIGSWKFRQNWCVITNFPKIRHQNPLLLWERFHTYEWERIRIINVRVSNVKFLFMHSFGKQRKPFMYKQYAFNIIPKISYCSQLHIKDTLLNIFMKMSTNAPWLAVETTARVQIQTALINVNVTLIIQEHIARKV